jgi:protein SCO1/2
VPEEPEKRRRSLLESPYAWIAIGGIAVLTVLRVLFPPPPPPPVLGRVAEFRLVDTRGEPYGSPELADHVWVANTFFTRCGSICPKLMSDTAVLAERLLAARAVGVRIVSVTVDPEYDTPDVLRAYGALRSIDAERWALLTGARADVEAFVTQGLRLGMGRPVADPAGLMDIAHAGKLVVVDGAGCVRGYFDTDAEGLDAAYRTALLVRAAPCE